MQMNLESREEKKQIDVFSDTLLSIDHLDTLKLGFEKVYNYGITEKKNLYVTEGRDYTFIYYDTEAIKKVSGTVLAINCEKDTSQTTGKIKINPFIYNEKEKIKLDSKYIAPLYIAIDNIQDAYDITEYEFSKGDSKVMILGITETTVRCLVVNLKLIDSDFDHSIKEVNLMAGNTYRIQYYRDKALREIKGLLLKIEEVEVYPETRAKFVRYNNEKEPERMFYDASGPIVPPKKESEKDKYFSLPETTSHDVLLTFDIGDGNVERLFVSTIRDIPSSVPVLPKPMDKRNKLKVNVSANTIYTYSKNAMHIYIRSGLYTSWPTDLTKEELIGLYPSEYTPIAYHPSTDGNYTVLCEFKDGYKYMTSVAYAAKTETPTARLANFIEKFNAYILKYYGAYSGTPLLKFRTESSSILYLDINYGMIQKSRDIPPIFIEDDTIREMFNTLLLESFNNNTKIQINDSVVYTAAALNGENIRKYLVTIMNRIFTNISAMVIDSSRSTLVNTDTVKFSNTDDTSVSTFTLNIGLIGGDQSYLKSCSAALADVINVSITSSGTGYGLDTYTNIPTITIYTSNQLKNYLDLISTTRRTAYNGITVNEFLNILKKLDIMSDSKPQYLTYYEDCMKRLIRSDIGITKWLNRFSSFTHIINGVFTDTLASKAFIVNRESGDSDFNKILTTVQNNISDGFKLSLMESYSYASKSTTDANYDIMSELATFNLDGIITDQKCPVLIKFNVYTKEELES